MIMSPIKVHVDLPLEYCLCVLFYFVWNMRMKNKIMFKTKKSLIERLHNRVMILIVIWFFLIFTWEPMIKMGKSVFFNLIILCRVFYTQINYKRKIIPELRIYLKFWLRLQSVSWKPILTNIPLVTTVMLDDVVL